jgi:hypothetical protein
MTDPYASEEETKALLVPDTRTQAERKLAQMMTECGADEQGAEAYPILRQIAVELLAEQPAHQEPVAFKPVAKRRVFDYIRRAYDLGYNDARNAGAIPGDGAPGYKGRDVEANHGSALLHALEAITSSPAQRMTDSEADLKFDEWCLSEDRHKNKPNDSSADNYIGMKIHINDCMRQAWKAALDIKEQP